MSFGFIGSFKDFLHSNTDHIRAGKPATLFIQPAQAARMQATMSRTAKESAGEIAERCLAAHARLLARVVSGVFDDGLRPVGLTSSQMVILTALEYSGGAQPAQLCEVLKLDKSTLSRNVERMERNGWIVREACSDARSHLLRLTAEGRRTFLKAVPHWRQAQQEAEELLGSAGANAVAQASRRLRGF